MIGNVTFLAGFFEEDDDRTLCRSPWFEDFVVRQATRLLEEFQLSLDGLCDTVSLLTDSLLLFSTRSSGNECCWAS